MSPSGEEEFRLLFAQESTQRLTRLQEQLMDIEATGATEELVSSVFRDAHTLKGAAAVLGFGEVTSVAQAMEDVLDDVRNHVRPVDSVLVDMMLGAVDDLGALAQAALDGHDVPGLAVSAERRIRGLNALPNATELENVTPPAREIALAAKVEENELAAAKVEPKDPSPNGPRVPGSFTLPEPIPVAAEHGESAAATAAVAPRIQSAIDTVMVPGSRLDGLVRLVGETSAAQLRLSALVEERFSSDPAVVAAFRDLTRALHELQEGTMRIRMVPISSITDSLRRGVRDAAHSLGKEVRWEVRGGDTELDRGVLQLIADPLMHLLRNAVDHGIETPAERVGVRKAFGGNGPGARDAARF